MLTVTTSWDDGDILDLKLAELLSCYKVRGTFYVTKNYRLKRLSDEQITELSKKHEIGAHTITHPDLRMDTGEIKESKEWLENLLSSKVEMFCYPKGLYNDSVVEAVKKAGFLGARTTELGSLTISDPFLMPTTLQVYPFPYYRHFRSYKQRAPALKALGVSTLSMYSWLSTAKATFNIALNKGGTFHLYGHSWEIEKHSMWNDLEKFLKYISSNKDCVYLTNSGTLVRHGSPQVE